MTTITSVRHPPGRPWGVLSLVFVAIPLPWLFALTILSLVVQGNTNSGSEDWVYGIIAAVGLFLFPIFLLLALASAIYAVTKPRIAGKVMGWITITVVILAIPMLWVAYGVWIIRG